MTANSNIRKNYMKRYVQKRCNEANGKMRDRRSFTNCPLNRVSDMNEESQVVNLLIVSGFFSKKPKHPECLKCSREWGNCSPAARKKFDDGDRLQFISQRG